jgi:hypothetical protein
MTTTTRLVPFPLGSTSDVETFERHLHTYVKARTGFDSLSHFSLARVHEALLKESSGSRVFAAMVDLRISLALLEQHTIALGRLLNRSIPDEENKALNESEASFLARMEIHDHANAFVLRFRSIWDKVMGVLVLRFEPSRYESFINAKSKRAAFRKILPAHPVIPADFVSAAEAIIRAFDDRLRTPESHGTGTLRKTSFTWSEIEASPPIALLGYWNFLNDVMHTLGKLFDPGLSDEVRETPAVRTSPTA